MTLFTIPKPFEDHIGTIQRNALESWSRLDPPCEVLVLGDEPGTAEAAEAVGAVHEPDIEVNEYGTPKLDSAFDQAREEASSGVLCYVNADILLTDDLVEAVERVPFDDYLAVSQRWDLDIEEAMEFSPEWQRRLRRRAREQGSLHPRLGCDLFIFPTSSELGSLPPFLVGRPTWDNWMIYNARRLDRPVVDMTKVVTVVHQNHGYGHVPDQSEKGRWEGPEADHNREILGDSSHHFTLDDVTHVVTPRMVRPVFHPRILFQRMRRLPVLWGD